MASWRAFALAYFSSKLCSRSPTRSPVTAHLVGIGGADTFAGGAYFPGTHWRLLGGVEHTVGGEYEVCLFRDIELAGDVVSAGGQCFGFLLEEYGVEYDTVADDVDFTTLEYARGYGAEHIFLAVEFQRMAGIRAALETGDDVVFRSENIDDFAFAFVAPLQS